MTKHLENKARIFFNYLTWSIGQLIKFSLSLSLSRETQEQNRLMQVDPEHGVTVVFHVMLESNFKMEEESLHIRASGLDLGDFNINCVDMSLTAG